MEMYQTHLFFVVIDEIIFIVRHGDSSCGGCGCCWLLLLLLLLCNIIVGIGFELDWIVAAAQQHLVTEVIFVLQAVTITVYNKYSYYIAHWCSKTPLRFPTNGLLSVLHLLAPPVVSWWDIGRICSDRLYEDIEYYILKLVLPNIQSCLDRLESFLVDGMTKSGRTRFQPCRVWKIRLYT